MEYRGIFVMVLCAIMSIESSPTTNNRCKKDDGPCITKMCNTIYKTIIVGIPSMDIDSLSPLYQDDIEGNFATVNYKLTKSTIDGFKDCEVTNTTLSLEKQTMKLSIECPYFVAVGFYEVEGNLLTLPIKGKGDYRVDCKDYHIAIDIDIKVSRKDDKRYLSFKNFRVDPDLRGGLTIDLKNEYNKHQDQNDNEIDFINKNWKPISKLLQAPVFTANVKKMLKNFNKYLKSTPLDTLIF